MCIATINMAHGVRIFHMFISTEKSIYNPNILLHQVPVKIPVEDRELDGVFNFPCESSWNGCAVVMTHGAGGDVNYLHLEKLASHLASTGILCLRFTCRTRNFLYRTECFAAVVVRSMFSNQIINESCAVCESCNIRNDFNNKLNSPGYLNF